MSRRHVVIVAYPGQGHINPMIQLGFRLSDQDDNLVVTIALTRRNHDAIHRSWQQSGKLLPQNLRLRPIRDDILPFRSMDTIWEFVDCCQKLKDPFLELATHMEQEDGGKIRSIISDTMLDWVPEASQELGAQWIAFFPLPVSSLLVYLNIDFLKKQGVLFNGERDSPIEVPGLRVLPSEKDLPQIFLVMDGIKEMLKTAAWIIVNTCHTLESEEVREAGNLFGYKNMLPIGPLQPREVFQGSGEPVILTGALSSEEASSLTWLNSGKPRSTIYVSFGSIASISLSDLFKLVEALVDSGERFLWVLRKDFLPGTDEGEFDKLVSFATQSGRGHVVHWAPQLKVLRHPAVGAFLTHCGWNSTFESICAGIPMVTWPCFAEQRLNARYILDVWKVGVGISPDMDMRNVLKGVMKNEVLRENAAELGRKCRADFQVDSNQQLVVLAKNI